jgi:hypothetical protein
MVVFIESQRPLQVEQESAFLGILSQRGSFLE